MHAQSIIKDYKFNNYAGIGASNLLTAQHISLRGVEVHNLRSVDIDLPHYQLVVFCGVSGSGKTSLALDTLYAEGQRRYIESFSAYTRQFLQQLEKPAAERIEGIPPAIAVRPRNGSRSSRSTVGTATEIADYLRLLYAKIGDVVCYGCQRLVTRDTPTSAAKRMQELPDGTRLMVSFGFSPEGDMSLADAASSLQADGFVRAIVGSRVLQLDDVESIVADKAAASLQVVVDRLVAGETDEDRILDSLESALAAGNGKCAVYALPRDADANIDAARVTIDDREWKLLRFSTVLCCEDCGIDYPDPQGRLYSFNSPLGACPECEGFGNIIDIDMDLVVPDPLKTLRDGAIAPWNTPAYAHELEELVALADDCDIPLDIPFRDLSEKHLELIHEGVPSHEFGGLKGFFAWLERRKYKMHLRVFLSRWRSYRRCQSCHGSRLRPEALATRVGGKNIAEICELEVRHASEFFESLELTDWQRQVGKTMLEQIESRLRYLQEVGLGYLELDRTLRTLSGGEMQRVTLTSALGSSLVNMLYVLDEPSVGLHPRDVGRLVEMIKGLRDRRNTVVVVEHEEEVLRAADHLVEIGPAAGRQGGRVVFEGTPNEMVESEESLTGDYLTGRRGIVAPEKRRAASNGWVRLRGASGNNLKNLEVEFPLGVICLVTGVSGAGKSTLVQDTLYPALCRRKRKDAPKPAPYDDVFGDGQLDDIILVDQSPVGRSPRSNPVTYIKAFDEIRAVFADTLESRTHNYTASHFSFNVDGGRCNACKGDGYTEIDMQFLANVLMKCSQCGGTRYRREILNVTYRGLNIAEVLRMTIRDAFGFFRGQTKVQTKLKRLIDVGLDYLQLGQPAATLSAGEAQRLKLAGYMSSAKRGRTLFILDEPTTGLHFSDIVQLLDCFEALVAVGHSLIIVEHNLQLMKAADYIIDLGPGAAKEGGNIVVQGTPEQVANCRKSLTGQYLAKALKE